MITLIIIIIIRCLSPWLFLKSSKVNTGNKNKFSKFIASFTTFLKETLYLCIAFGLICLLFYIRLLPRAARDLWQNLTHYQLLSLVVSLFFLMVNIYIFLKLLELIPTRITPWLENLKAKVLTLRARFFWLFINFYKFIWFILNAMATKIFHYEGLQYDVLRTFAKNFMKQEYYNSMSKIIILLALLPNIIFTTAFVYDVFYCSYLNYTFKCIPLWLIPLGEQVIFYVFFDYYDTYWPDINAFVRKKETRNPNKAFYFFIPEFSVTPPPFVKDFRDFFFNHFVPLHNTQEFLEYYKYWKYKKSFYVHMALFLCILRFVVFSYLLVYGLR